MAKPDHKRRALLERLWAEGVDTRTIARRMGWSAEHPPSNYIAMARRRGLNLPPRNEKRSRAVAAAHARAHAA